METVICDIAKNRMVKDFNNALKDMGLFVSSIRFEENQGLKVVIEIAANEGVILFCAS